MSANCLDRVLRITPINKCSDYRLLYVTVSFPDNSLHGIYPAQLLSHLTNRLYTNAEYNAIDIATDRNGRIGAKIDNIETVDIDVPPRTPIVM